MFWPKAYFHAVISSLFSLRCNVLLKSAQLHGTSNSTTCPYAPPAIEDRNTTLARRNNNPGERGGRLQEELDIDEYSQKKPPREIKPLLEHMKEKHSQTFCVLCYVHKRSYLSSLTRYGVKELEGHLREEGEVTGHAKVSDEVVELERRALRTFCYTNSSLRSSCSLAVRVLQRLDVRSRETPQTPKPKTLQMPRLRIAEEAQPVLQGL